MDTHLHRDVHSLMVTFFCKILIKPSVCFKMDSDKEADPNILCCFNRCILGQHFIFLQ